MDGTGQKIWACLLSILMVVSTLAFVGTATATQPEDVPNEIGENGAPEVQVTGLRADAPVVYLDQNNRLVLSVSNFGNATALKVTAKVTDIVPKVSEELISMEHFGALKSGMEKTCFVDWTPTVRGVHYVKVELKYEYLTHNSPAELVESPPTILSAGFPVTPMADEIIYWYDGHTIPNGVTEEYPTAGKSSSEIRMVEDITGGNLVIEDGGTLIFNDGVTFIIENTIAGEFGIQIDPSASFVISSPSRTTTIQSSSGSPTYTYPFLNSGTVDFLGADVTYTYGDKTNLALGGGIQNLQGSSCIIDNCELLEADTHSLYINGTADVHVRGAGTIIGRDDANPNPEVTKGHGIFVNGATPVIEDITVQYQKRDGIRIENSLNATIDNARIASNLNNGISIKNASNVTIFNGTRINNNSMNGIDLFYSAQIHISDCEIVNQSKNGQNGIYAIHSNNNIILNNLLFSNYNGLTFQYSYNNTISSNNIINNTWDGISLFKSPMVANNIVTTALNASSSMSPDKILVKLKAPPVLSPMFTMNAINEIEGSIGGKLVNNFQQLGILEFELAGNMAVLDTISKLREDPRVLYAEPDYIVTTNNIPNDTLFDYQWALNNYGQTGGTPDADINAIDAWNITTGSRDVVVAIIDSGVDYTHMDLADNMWTNTAELYGIPDFDDDGNGYVDDIYGIDAFNDDSNPMDDYFHGTHCAGTIGGVGNNGKNVSGVCWNVSMMALKFTNNLGGGTLSDAIECIEYMINMKENGVNIKIASNSWGGGGYSQALYDAIAECRDHDILFVAAAGNAGANADYTNTLFPAAYDLTNIISVAATDHNDSLARFSNYGSACVDVAAPGVDILSTLPNNNSGNCSGTSMATPHVAGLASLISSFNPNYTYHNIKNLIMSSVDIIPGLDNKLITNGRINAYSALNFTPPSSTMRLLVHSPGDTNILAKGFPTLVSALLSDGINPICGASIMVEFTTSEPPIYLYDDGTGVDQEANDGYYSGFWYPGYNGNVNLTFIASSSGYNNIYSFTSVNVISGNNIHENTITLCNNGIRLERSTSNTISNNNISYCNKGVWLDYANDNNVLENNITNSLYGIYEYGVYSTYGNFINTTNLSTSPHWGNTLQNNTLYNCTLGISLMYAVFSTIIGNNITYCDNGISLTISDRNRILGNSLFANNYDGIFLSNAMANEVISNTIDSSTNSGIYAELSTENIILNNSVLNNDFGIYFVESSNNLISRNNVSFNVQYGIYLSNNANNNTIIANTASNNLVGIYLESSNSNTIANNTASGNEEGIIFEFSSNNTIQNNNAFSNFYDGIYLSSSNYNNILNNTVMDNLFGIYIDNSIDNTIANNIVSNNGNGITLYASPSNTLAYNEITSNHDYGIYIDNMENYNDSVILLNNTVNGTLAGPGIRVLGARVNITGNEVRENRGSGIVLENSKGEIAHNAIFRNHKPRPYQPPGGPFTGIEVLNSADIWIHHNNVSWNDYNIDLVNSRNVLIEWNTIVDESAVTELYPVGSPPPRGVRSRDSEMTLANNTFYGCIYSVEILNANETTKLANNIFLPLDGQQLFHEAGIYLMNASVLIQENTFDGIGGIAIWCTEGSDAQIVGNTISNCNETGIYCNASSPTINNNTITFNYHGIYCENGANAIIRYNNITGNVHYGVINVDSAVLVDATYNWWGDWRGPWHPSNPLTEGDEISDYVDFYPCLMDPYP